MDETVDAASGDRFSVGRKAERRAAIGRVRFFDERGRVVIAGHHPGATVGLDGGDDFTIR